MQVSKELLEKAKSAKSAEELREMAKAGNIGLSTEKTEKVFAELHKTGELSDGELDNVAGGGCSDSGDTPKFCVGQRVWEAAGRGHYPVKIVAVSDEKKDCGGMITSNVFTYDVQPEQKGAPLEKDVPEFNLVAE